jgi:hypothetical protein
MFLIISILFIFILFTGSKKIITLTNQRYGTRTVLVHFVGGFLTSFGYTRQLFQILRIFIVGFEGEELLV